MAHRPKILPDKTGLVEMGYFPFMPMINLLASAKDHFHVRFYFQGLTSRGAVCDSNCLFDLWLPSVGLLPFTSVQTSEWWDQPYSSFIWVSAFRSDVLLRSPFPPKLLFDTWEIYSHVPFVNSSGSHLFSTAVHNSFPSLHPDLFSLSLCLSRSLSSSSPPFEKLQFG